MFLNFLIQNKKSQLAQLQIENKIAICRKLSSSISTISFVVWYDNLQIAIWKTPAILYGKIYTEAVLLAV